MFLHRRSNVSSPSNHKHKRTLRLVSLSLFSNHFYLFLKYIFYFSSSWPLLSTCSFDIYTNLDHDGPLFHSDCKLIKQHVYLSCQRPQCFTVPHLLQQSQSLTPNVLHTSHFTTPRTLHSIHNSPTTNHSPPAPVLDRLRVLVPNSNALQHARRRLVASRRTWSVVKQGKSSWNFYRCDDNHVRGVGGRELGGLYTTRQAQWRVGGCLRGEWWYVKLLFFFWNSRHCCLHLTTKLQPISVLKAARTFLIEYLSRHAGFRIYDVLF